MLEPESESPFTKVSFNLPREELEALKQLAEGRNMKMTEVLLSAIRTEKYLWARYSKERAKFLIETDKGIREVVLFR